MTKPKSKANRRRNYSDEEKAAAIATLAAEGGNLKKAARILGLSPSTLRGWRDHPMPVAPELAEAAVGTLDQLLEGIALKLATGLNKPDVLAKILTKPVQAATVLGITSDKLVALRTKTVTDSKMTLSEFLSLAKWVEDKETPGRIVPSLEAINAPSKAH